MPGRVLVLAGTTEARHLLEQCKGLDVEASLAGTTQVPDLAGPMRIGGFGGEAGFRAALAAYSAVLDATHPFASNITERAGRVCGELDVPYLRLTRPPWVLEPGWISYGDVAECAASLPRGARVFLTTGPGSLAPFLKSDLRLWCRRIDPAPVQEGVTWIIGKPGDETAETGLLRDLGVAHLVAKNSGGPSVGKLRAANTLGIKVHLINRPNIRFEGGETHDINQALEFVKTHAHHHL